MELAQTSFPSNRGIIESEDNTVTMTPQQMFQSRVNDAGVQYATVALSHPDGDTYRKNFARYLDTKGLDLVAKDKQLFIGDRENPLQLEPVTSTFLGNLAGSAPEIIASIIGGRFLGMAGAVGGSVVGDGIQQGINSYFLGEELTPDQRIEEGAKSAALSLGGEVTGKVVSRAITPLRGINKAAQKTNNELAGKYGVKLTPASATGHKGLAQFEEVMQKSSLGGKNIAASKSNEILGIENVGRDLLENRMGGTTEVSNSGASLAYNLGKQKDIAQGYFNQQYKALASNIGGDRIPMPQLHNIASEIIERTKRIPAFKGTIDTLAERILQSPKKLSYEEFSQLRTFIGGKIKDASVTGQSGSKEAYKKLYKAINNDFDEVFKGTDLHSYKRALDDQFRSLYKEPFEDTFTRNITGSGRSAAIDEERIGGLIANSSGKAKIAANTADSAFTSTDELFQLSARKQPKQSLSAAADSILKKSEAPDGGMSLNKLRTNLKNATGADELFKINNKVIGQDAASAFNKVRNIDRTNLVAMKNDIIELINISTKNQKVQNSSGTAYMNELIRMKNDPWSALLGFVSDRGMDATYKRALFQKWLTNNLITKEQYRALIKASSQVGVRTYDANSPIEQLGL